MIVLFPAALSEDCTQVDDFLRDRVLFGVQSEQAVLEVEVAVVADHVLHFDQLLDVQVLFFQVDCVR